MLIKNRRFKIRMGILIPCYLRLVSTNSSSSGDILDLSFTGVQIKSDSRFTPNQKILVTFSIKNRFRFNDIEGVIAWAKTENKFNLAGIEFDSPLLYSDQIYRTMLFMIDYNLASSPDSK